MAKKKTAKKTSVKVKSFWEEMGLVDNKKMTIPGSTAKTRKAPKVVQDLVKKSADADLFDSVVGVFSSSSTPKTKAKKKTTKPAWMPK